MLATFPCQHIFQGTAKPCARPTFALSFFCFAVAALIFSALPLPASRADTFVRCARQRGVVAGGQPLSVEAGLRILQRGGNAVDAGVATILAASVIEFSHFLLARSSHSDQLKNKDVAVVEGRGQAPIKLRANLFINERKERELRSGSDRAPTQ